MGQGREPNLLATAPALRGPALAAAALAGRHEAAGAVLSRALAEWLMDEDGPDLLARLGLPATRPRIRNDARDYHLVAAAELLTPGARLAIRAHALMEAAELFARLRWPSWQYLPGAPAGANTVEQHLHAAFRAHGYRRRNSEQHGIEHWSETYFRRLLK